MMLGMVIIQAQEVAKDSSAYELERLLAEAVEQSQPAPKRLRLVSSSKRLEQQSGGQQLLLMQDGDHGYPSYDLEVECTTNTYSFYGVTSFENSSWITVNNPPSQYPWHLVTDTPDGGSSKSMQSYTSANYPAGSLITCRLFTKLTNSYDQFGDPKRKKVTFYYQSFNSGGSLKCSMSFLGDNGTAYTNLPLSGSWRRASLLVPPYPSYNATNYPYLNFVHTKNTSSAHAGGDSLVAYVQVCDIDTPSPTAGDFKVVALGSDTVRVQWNTFTYPTNKWVLTRASSVSSGFTTNIGTSVTYVPSTNMAYITVSTSTNDMSLYRLLHSGLTF